VCQVWGFDFFLEGFVPSWANEVVIAFLGSPSGCIGRVGISIFFKCREWCMKHLMVEYRAADIKLLFPRQPKFCEHAGGGRPNDSKVDNLFHQTAFCAHIETTNGLPCIEFMRENQGS
jgi:hypothetical protein